VTALQDLRTAAAFTYTDTVSIYNCSSVVPTNKSISVTYLTTVYAAIVNGTNYPAQNTVVITTLPVYATTTFYESYTFPGLTVTSLTRGEVIQMVFHKSCKRTDLMNRAGLYTHLTHLPLTQRGSGLSRMDVLSIDSHHLNLMSSIFVPTDAITPVITSATVATTSTTPPSSGSVNVGAIAGGAIGGVSSTWSDIRFRILHDWNTSSTARLPTDSL
jgi:hypothetical protein